MEDSNINGVELEEGITTNVPEVAQEAPATEVEPSEPKTLRDAVMKAFEKKTDKVEAITPPLAGQNPPPVAGSKSPTS